MKFFIDTADIDEIRELAVTGLLDGVTTNPSLIAKSGRPLFDVLGEICEAVEGPVSAEVTATNVESMIAEGHKLARIAKNITVKVPLTWDGLRACRALRTESIQVNITLCFTSAQAILAAKAGASFVSPFIGRLDDISQNGMQLIQDIVQIYRQYPDSIQTEVLVASVRHPLHAVEAAKLGANVITLPPKVLRQMINHPFTDIGLKAFLEDWDKTGQKIIK